MTELYLILGSDLEAQRDLANYLRLQGFEDSDSAAICVPEKSAASVGSESAWTIDPDESLSLSINPGDHEAIFLLCSPEDDPRPLLEATAIALQESSMELSRIFTIVDCHQLCERPLLKAYYELCLHFSDVFLLGNRSEVSKKWVQGYIDELKKKAVPTRVEYLKPKGKIDKVSELLFPEARRVSQIFDPIDGPEERGLIIESLAQEDDLENEEDTVDIDLRNPEDDPYLQRFEDASYEIKLRTYPEYP